ncbi:MAG: PAS domain-containing protein, partial [Proteobacteria bacterium]|nr:PAS domain-containing protein [Pseudomonadota bacterium]
RDMIYRMSLPEGRYEYVNPASKNLWGYSPEEFYNTPLLIDKIIHPDGRAAFDQQWKELMTGDGPFSWEYQIIHKSGEIRWMHQRNSFFRNDRGEPIAVEGVVTDVTEKKKAEQALKARKTELEIEAKNLEDANVEYRKKIQEYAYDVTGRLIANRREEQRFKPIEGLWVVFHKPSFFKWGRTKSIKLGQIVDISPKGLALLYPGKEIQSTNFNKLSISIPSLNLKTDKILYKAISDKAILSDVYKSARLCRIEFDGLTPAQQSRLNDIINKCALTDHDANRRSGKDRRQMKAAPTNGLEKRSGVDRRTT